MVEYGRAALDALRDAVAEHKAGDALAPVTVLAPNNLAALTARRHLARGVGGRAGVVNVDVTTLSKLSEKIAAPAMHPRRPLTGPVLTSALRRALDEDPGLFAEVAEHPATVEALTKAYREVRDVSSAALDGMATTSDVAREFVRLFRQVRETLEGSWYDPTDLLQAAASRPATGTFILYLPQDLSQAESRLAEALAGGDALSVIPGLTGATRADAGVERTLARLNVANIVPPQIRTATNVLNASDSDDEIRCVVRDLTKTLQSTPAHRVAVLYTGTSPYARLLYESLNSAGITTNGPGARPVSERSVARILLETLALVDSGASRPELFRAIASGPTRDFAGERIPTARWERVSREAGVVSGDDWQVRLDGFIAAAQRSLEDPGGEPPEAWRIERIRRRIDEASQLRDFAGRLRQELADASEMTTWSGLSKWCLTLFTTLIDSAKLPLEEQYAYAAVTTTVSELVGLDAVDSHASFDVFRQVLSSEFERVLPRVGRFGEGVLVAPVSAAIGLDLDVAYVVGLSEDLYPGRLREDALLPDRVRGAANGELSLALDGLYAKYRYLLAAFQVAPQVVASFPRGDLRRSSHRLPSRWLLPTLRELSNDRELAATKWETAQYGQEVTHSGSFAGQLLTTKDLGTEQEWRTRRAAAGGLDDATVDAARAMIEARTSHELTRFDGNLTAESGLPNYAVDNKAIAPTALESYADCPHAYFVRRLLGVSPLEKPEDVIQISPMDIGNLIHEAMDRLIKRFEGTLPGYGAPWSTQARDALAEIAEELAEEFQHRGLTGHPRLWERERTRILDDLHTMLDTDDHWRASLNARVVASEMPFGQSGHNPVEVPIQGGRVLMRGSADKVDETTHGELWVTDVKTGSKSPYADISTTDPIAKGTKLQLPVYAHAARERYGNAETAVHASYWFVRKDKGRVDLSLSDAVEKKYQETLYVLVRSIANGLFPAKPPETDDFAWVKCEYCNPDGVGYDGRERWQSKHADPALTELVNLIDPSESAE
ncbi:PD-(D/E)XK nuclease family protein [Smaragdicoccus niigatensis]|uniref:PD-(D/E)XK nuclease family protein n=1 Tax=Smaragdicoccus niigatensis TaxID=359359 RepID=UPI0003758E5D|nr:PD-(D/E)XK nuclease family protein [Smaragdicoccus niigatensis]